MLIREELIFPHKSEATAAALSGENPKYRVCNIYSEMAFAAKVCNCKLLQKAALPHNFSPTS